MKAAAANKNNPFYTHLGYILPVPVLTVHARLCPRQGAASSSGNASGHWWLTRLLLKVHVLRTRQ